MNKKIILISLILISLVGIVASLPFDINPSFTNKVDNLTVCKNPQGKLVASVVCEVNKNWEYTVDISDTNLVYKNDNEVHRIKYG